MSGGSYDYLTFWENDRADDLRRMAGRLAELGHKEAARATAAFAASPPAELRELWRAVEWLDSGDGGIQAVSRAGEVYARSTEAVA